PGFDSPDSIVGYKALLREGSCASNAIKNNN
ncbi:unnamed protein product, partial [marine sediment metagenome]